MTFGRTVRGVLMIGAVPAVLVMGTATPAAAHEAGYSKSQACRFEDPAAYWTQYRQHWASSEEFRAYYERYCSDGDRAARLVEDRHATEVDKEAKDKPEKAEKKYATEDKSADK